MVTDRTKCLQKNLENMVTEELGYVDAEELEKKIVTEELRIQWLQIFDQNGYRTGNTMVTEELET